MKPGRDFDPNDTYCGNVSAVSIKIALSLASNFNLIMKGGDLKGAYLVTRSNPDYVTYIATPQGYNIPAGYVLVASGNLYGLQVAGHNFSKQFGICVALCGFIFCQYDPKFYWKFVENRLIIQSSSSIREPRILRQRLH